MPGELWRVVTQIGKETTRGTPVAATRKLYLMEPVLEAGVTNRFHRFAVNARASQRAVTPGFLQPGGTLRQTLSPAESLELFAMALGDPTTTTTVGGNTQHVFTDAGTPNAATIEWSDGANVWQEAGVSVNELTIAGDVQGANEITATLFGTDFQASALTASLADRTPTFVEGWETKFYIDAFGGTAGTTAVDCFVRNWSITFRGNLERKYGAKNSRTACDIHLGEVEVSGSLTVWATEAQADTEFTALLNATKRLPRLTFGNNAALLGGENALIHLDLPGAWESIDLGGSNEGGRTYQLNFQGIYDSTNGFMYRATSISDRATLY